MRKVLIGRLLAVALILVDVLGVLLIAHQLGR